MFLGQKIQIFMLSLRTMKFAARALTNEVCSDPTRCHASSRRSAPIPHIPSWRREPVPTAQPANLPDLSDPSPTAAQRHRKEEVTRPQRGKVVSGDAFRTQANKIDVAAVEAACFYWLRNLSQQLFFISTSTVLQKDSVSSNNDEFKVTSGDC